MQQSNNTNIVINNISNKVGAPLNNNNNNNKAHNNVSQLQYITQGHTGIKSSNQHYQSNQNQQNKSNSTSNNRSNLVKSDNNNYQPHIGQSQLHYNNTNNSNNHNQYSSQQEPILSNNNLKQFNGQISTTYSNTQTQVCYQQNLYNPNHEFAEKEVVVLESTAVTSSSNNSNISRNLQNKKPGYPPKGVSSREHTKREYSGKIVNPNDHMMSPVSNKVTYQFISPQSNGKTNSVGKIKKDPAHDAKKISDKSNLAYGFKNSTVSNASSKKENNQTKLPSTNQPKNPFLKKNNNGQITSNGLTVIDSGTTAFERNGSPGFKKVTNFQTSFQKCRGSPTAANYRNKK